MSFFLFILYVLFTYLRPFDTVAVELASYRPMLILWALAFFGALWRAAVRNEVAGRPVHFALIGFLILIIGLSQVANQWVGGALPAIMEFSTAAMLMVLCMLNLTSLRRLQVTTVVIAGSIVVLAALGSLSFHTGFMADELVIKQTRVENEDRDTGADEVEYDVPAHDKTGRYLLRVRSVGFLNDPNDFAQSMVMLLPFLWWLYAPGRWLRNLVLVVAPAGLLFYTILLTQSRGALLGVAALGIMVAHKLFGTFRTALLVGLLAVGVGAVSLGGRGISSTEQSAAQRVDAWQAGITMLRSKPVLGVGFGNFLDHHELTAHNSIVLCFAELGLVGYFAWMGLLVITLKGLMQAVRNAPTGTPEHRLAVAMRAGLIAYLACAWFLSRTYSPGLFLLLALGVATWYVIRKTYGPPPASTQEQPLQWRLATMVAMVLGIGAVYGFVVVQRIVT